MKAHVLGALVLAACAAEAPQEIALEAVDDTLDVELNTPVELDLVANDRGVDDAPTVALVGTPASGMATLEGGVLRYAPAPDFLGDDQLRYAITNADGTTSEASVQVRVGCATCAVDSPITLTWTANPPEQMVTGYRIYFGTSEDAASMVMVDDIEVDEPGFDNTAPTRTFDAWQDFKLRYGDRACFRMTAYNGAGESDFTGAACKDITTDRMALVL